MGTADAIGKAVALFGKQSFYAGRITSHEDSSHVRPQAATDRSLPQGLTPENIGETLGTSGRTAGGFRRKIWIWG
ncbi:hypothetical protein AMK01_CH03530 [Rhizobium sp. N6212]|nr:hypothetical protein AMK01_CH03530 [Rhizobium sp. N6212]ANK98996.1 hypothetical protein AMK00_CH03533 [Rhizobium sp. N621]ANL05124.1 hypothetical protein AMJ99_CH03609 [Rhizobium esperanzae]ANL11181.1 hypothetical protein AMJ98_CH03560 [Rhizobium sp. N1341]ANM35964.1 hypothetical protein AMK04_CH03614 [Rhizobium sp. N871]ANM42025.1 hypothetical protein AMK03_CH03563 [Rhizobium sp. N741]